MKLNDWISSPIGQIVELVSLLDLLEQVFPFREFPIDDLSNRHPKRYRQNDLCQWISRLNHRKDWWRHQRWKYNGSDVHRSLDVSQKDRHLSIRHRSIHWIGTILPEDICHPYLNREEKWEAFHDNVPIGMNLVYWHPDEHRSKSLLSSLKNKIGQMPKQFPMPLCDLHPDSMFSHSIEEIEQPDLEELNSSEKCLFHHRMSENLSFSFHSMDQFSISTDFPSDRIEENHRWDQL